MIVTNDSWQLVGSEGPGSLLIQNVGDVKIAYVVAAAQPADDAYPMHYNDGAFFIISPLVAPTYLQNLGTDNVYARAIGPRDGSLTVHVSG